VQFADEAYCIGPSESSKSYLSISRIITIAKLSKCDAIHPGYGYLSENAEFAELCDEMDIEFLGPSSNAIKNMGLKDIAKEMMKKADVPVVPGSNGILRDLNDAYRVADKVGYPVILKASSGGGGKGIRVVKDKKAMSDAFNLTKEEARKSFDNSDIYLEKYIEDFRHIEIQILGDKYGNIIQLGERDCTVQRKMQKIIEETPSPSINNSIRKKMGDAAVQAALAVNYHSAGTVEFIFDRTTENFYFMEMNTRIQVEHPITEIVNDIDLVAEQIKIAEGKQLDTNKNLGKANKFAMECRINAENPDNNFAPSVGEITRYIPPGGYGVRVDSFLYTNYKTKPFYDSLVAKVVTFGYSRKEVIDRMIRALEEFQLEGI